MIFIPALNEAASIARVINSLPKDLGGYGPPTVLVVDDGSTDGTADAARSEGAIVVRHATNRGVGGAFQTGHQVALEQGADILVSIDADGQFDPDEIPALLAPLLAGQTGLVTGCRFGPAGRPANMSKVKYWGNLVVAAVVRSASGTTLRDVSCGFRAYSREALLHLNLFGKFTYTQETILDLAFKNIPICEVPVKVRYFSDRRSRVAGSILRYAMNAGKILVRTVRDFRPFRFFGTLGSGVFLFGAALDVWLLVHYLRTGSYSPYKAVGFAGGLLNVCGILLVGLGLLADMLDRMRVNQERILYLLRKHDLGD